MRSFLILILLGLGLTSLVNASDNRECMQLTDVSTGRIDEINALFTSLGVSLEDDSQDQESVVSERAINRTNSFYESLGDLDEVLENLSLLSEGEVDQLAVDNLGVDDVNEINDRLTPDRFVDLDKDIRNFMENVPFLQGLFDIKKGKLLTLLDSKEVPAQFKDIMSDVEEMRIIRLGIVKSEAAGLLKLKNDKYDINGFIQYTQQKKAPEQDQNN